METKDPREERGDARSMSLDAGGLPYRDCYIM